MLHGPNQPYMSANENNNADFTYLVTLFILLDYNEIHKKQKLSAFTNAEIWSVSHVTCVDIIV